MAAGDLFRQVPLEELDELARSDRPEPRDCELDRERIAFEPLGESGDHRSTVLRGIDP